LPPKTWSSTGLDEGLPLNFALWGPAVPIHSHTEELNRYLIKVKGLGPRTLRADGQRPAVGTWSAEQFGGGPEHLLRYPDGWVPGGPWDAQAATLIHAHRLAKRTGPKPKSSPPCTWAATPSRRCSRRIADLNERMDRSSEQSPNQCRIGLSSNGFAASQP